MLKNIGSNWIFIVLTILVTYILLPFNLGKLGHTQYGIWLLITSLTGYLGLLQLGVPMASVRFIAQHAAVRDDKAMNQAIGSCAGLFLLLGLAALLGGFLLMFFFEHAYSIPETLRYPARAAFILVIFQVAAGFLGMLPYGIMAAHQDYVIRNVALSTTLLLRFLMNLALVTRYPSLVALASVLLLSLLIDQSLLWYIVFRRYPAICLHVSNFRLATVRQIFSFSLFVLMLNVANRLTFQTDSLVIGKFISIGQIPHYTVANSLTMYLILFVTDGIADVVMPMATRLHTVNDISGLKQAVLKWSKIAFSFSLFAGIYLIIFGPGFIRAWVGPEFESPSGDVLRILMFSLLIFIPVRGIALPALMGLNKVKFPTLLFLGSAVLNLIMSIALAKPMGLNGIAWGTAAPNVLFAVGLLVYFCRELHISLYDYLQYVAGRALPAALLVAFVMWMIFRVWNPHSWTGLITSGFALIAIFAPVWIGFVYRNDEYLDVNQYLAKVPFWSKLRDHA